MAIDLTQIITSVVGGAILGGASAFFMLHGRISNLEGKVAALERAADPQRIQDLVRGFGAEIAKERSLNTGTSAPLSEVSTKSPEELPASALEMFSPVKSDFPLQGPTTLAKGTHMLPLSAHVWATLEDSYGNFYLQNPPVALHRDNTWTATIRPGTGITGVAIVLVDSTTHAIFLQKVQNNEWGAFQLPSGAKIIARVP